MTTEDRGIQTKVGIFLLLGLVAVGTMVIYFGRLGEGVRDYYTLRVEFPSASGLLRGSEVLLAGARIGRVSDGPTILPEMNGVVVDLRIFGDVKIPSASEFHIGSSGLLGDKFIEIRLKKDAKASSPIKPGETIVGTVDSGGFGEIAQNADGLITELRAAVKNINEAVEKVNTGVLSDEGVKTLAATLQNLRDTTERAARASQQIESVVAEAKTVVEGGKTAMDSAKGTLDSARKAAEELERSLADVRGLVRDIRQGRGALGMLVANKEVAENLRALVANLRRYGILWYRDGEKAKSPAPEPSR